MSINVRGNITFRMDLAENCRNCMTAKIKLPKAMVPSEFVDARIRALFHGATDEAEGSFR